MYMASFYSLYPPIAKSVAYRQEVTTLFQDPLHIYTHIATGP